MSHLSPTPATMPRCPTCQSEYEEDILYCPRDGALLLPTVVEGRYRLLSQLGAGGMGVVYLAEHVGLQKRVAVKVLRGELSRDATFARRFELEAIAASQIGHENIVDVTDLGRTPGGELYYVMELLEGQSLASLLYRERSLALARAVPILAQVCRALEAAHARGIVHRDVKPQNVMVLTRGERPDFVKVVDFGISKVDALQQGARLTEAGAILGTADYMSPEQATGGEVDARADVYAVGVLAYEVCTGTLPFRGENTFATLLQHVEARAEPPSRRRPELGLPRELDALVLQALAKEPAARPSMARLRTGLEALRPTRPPSSPLPLGEGKGEGVGPSRAEPGAPVALDAAVARADTVVKQSERARRGVGVWTVATGVGLAAVMTLGGAALLMRGTAPVLGELGAGDTVGNTVSSSPLTPPLSQRERGGVTQGVAVVGAHAEEARAHAAPRIVFASVPSGATVLRAGQVLGVTPLDIDRPADTAGPWRFVLDGHAPLQVDHLPADARVEVVLKKLPAPRVRKPTPAPAPMEKVQNLKPNPF
ncbi:MAG: serine/threonine protein kinase [Myxococcaceae bacterium]|nr:serine/threonine protein kinase [Myxococcaceae bacterium]MCI0670175.1 serine/threonine protein kinase [Myxococcaceae bacterium]